MHIRHWALNVDLMTGLDMRRHPNKIMINLREELAAVLEVKASSGGFHYVQRAEQLRQIAHRTRQWSTLLRTPPGQWQRILSDTRYVLDELKAIGFS